ncbi:hypothetical protein F2P56_005326 [Juglans regia]|uniref:Uncharacterized protein n=1 Tax=Juglans regia TaxID=51240 RepID=A0A833XWK0_JUGRE|nr:hypothetical protein F2P56_005326 [Juglans regia]
MVQWIFLLIGKLNEKRGDMEGSENGLWDFGNLWNGWNLQLAVHLYNRAVSNGGQKCSTGMCNTGGANGGNLSTVRGGFRGWVAVCGVWSVWDCGRDACVLLAGDIK